MEDAATDLALEPLPTARADAYGAPVTEWAGESLLRDKGTSLAEMAARVAAGGHIVDVAVVELAATGDYVPHIHCSWQPELGYRTIAMVRHDGSRSWSDFRVLRRALAGLGYTGPVVVYPEGHQRLTDLGIGAD